MPFCSSGTTQVKPGVVSNLVFAGGASGVLALVPGLEWLTAVAAVLGVVAYETPTLCASDPPAYPTFTTAEYLAAATRFPGSDYDSFYDKLGDVLARIVWFQACECASVATPAIGTQPANPGGTTVISGGSAGLPCLEFRSPGRLATGTRENVMGPFQLFEGSAYTAYTIPLDAPGSGTHSRWELWRGNTPDFVGASSVGPVLEGGNGISTRSTSPSNVLAGAFYWFVYWNGGATPDGSSSFVLQDWCQGNSPASPCGNCPDSVELLAQLMAIRAQVDLIQRQSAPFGYVASTAHSGLTDQGSLTVSDLIGVKIELTTIPDSYGRAAGDPIEFFDLGFITWGSADGYRTSTRIEHEHQVLFPPLAGAYTVVGYTLSPGVVMTLTELVREP